MRLKELNEAKDFAEIQKKEEKIVSKIKDITVTFAPKMDISGQGVIKPEFSVSGDDWILPIDKSKSKLPKGVQENYVRNIVDHLFFPWLEALVDGKSAETELKKDYGDLTYTAKINFK